MLYKTLAASKYSEDNENSVASSSKSGGGIPSLQPKNWRKRAHHPHTRQTNLDRRLNVVELAGSITNSVYPSLKANEESADGHSGVKTSNFVFDDKMSV